MVKIIEKSKKAAEIYIHKRNDEIKKVTERIVERDEIHYGIGFSAPCITILNPETKELKAHIDNTYARRSIILFDKEFFSTASKLAFAYEEVARNLRSSFSFLERLFIPKEEWIIEKQKHFYKLLKEQKRTNLQRK